MNEVTKAHCNVCGHETKHTRLFNHKSSESEYVEDYGPWECRDTYEMLECCGCESITFRHSRWSSDLPGDEEEVKQYPPPISRRVPKWKWQLSQPLDSLMDEIYAALHNNSHRLAMMGARTVVDLVMNDKVGDVGPFQQKLVELERQGFVARKNREFLAAALDAGSAAAHRAYEPTAEELRHVMDIVENLLEAVYILERAAKKLRDSTPPRRP